MATKITGAYCAHALVFNENINMGNVNMVTIVDTDILMKNMRQRIVMYLIVIKGIRKFVLI